MNTTINTKVYCSKCCHAGNNGKCQLTSSYWVQEDYWEPAKRITIDILMSHRNRHNDCDMYKAAPAGWKIVLGIILGLVGSFALTFYLRYLTS